MERSRRDALVRPSRVRDNDFWKDSMWGIDYTTGEHNGDGRAELWGDFCRAAKTCELTHRTCRLTPSFKAAVARVLQAFWQRRAPCDLPFYPDEPVNDEQLVRSTGGLYTYSTLLRAAAVHVLRATAEEQGLTVHDVPAFGSCALHACYAPEDGAQHWVVTQDGRIEENVPQLLALRAADAAWLRAHLATVLSDGRTVEVHLLDAAITEVRQRGSSDLPAGTALAAALDEASTVEATGDEADRTAAIEEYLTQLAASPSRVWYTPVALVARGAALGAYVVVVQIRHDSLDRISLTPRQADGDVRPVRYIGYLDAPGMPSHFVRLARGRQIDPDMDIAALLP